MESTRSDAARELLLAKSLVRAHELAQLGVAGETLQQLLRTGVVVRISRGLYAAPDRELTEHDQLAQLAIKHPRLVFCLLTALQIHGLTTQSPHQVWVAISPNARAPRVEYPPLRIVRLSDPGLGLEQITLDGVVHIPVTSVAKTVADCFKFRNKIGLSDGRLRMKAASVGDSRDIPYPSLRGAPVRARQADISSHGQFNKARTY